MTTLPAIAEPSRTPTGSGKAEKPRAVTGKVKAAIDAMVWEGLPRDKAAAQAGISPHGLYKALRSPHVKAHLNAELEVLRTSGRARRIHRLEAIAEQNSNLNAAVYAIRELDRDRDEAPAGGGRGSVPGVVIVVNTGGGPAQTIVQSPAGMGSSMGTDEASE
jgi:hypothetical protein